MAAFRIFKKVLIPTAIGGASASAVWSAKVAEKERSNGNETEVCKCRSNSDSEIARLEEVSDDRSTPSRPSDLPMYADKTGKSKCDFVCKPGSHAPCETCSTEKPPDGNTCGEMTECAKMGSIAGGGLLGAMLGWRSGIIKKLLLASMGSGAAAAAVYPEEAKKYADSSYCYLKENGEKAYASALAAYKDMMTPKCEPPPPPPPPPCPPEPPKC